MPMKPHDLDMAGHSMRRSLDIPARQITAICRGAAKAGYAPVLQIGKVIIRLIPEEHTDLAQEMKPVDEKPKGYL